jgi:hypothetical protein
MLSVAPTIQSQLSQSQAHRVTGNKIARKMGVFKPFVKPLSTQ